MKAFKHTLEAVGFGSDFLIRGMMVLVTLGRGTFLTSSEENQ
jgi:hypothetical protein